MIFLKILMQHLTCLSGPWCPKWVLCSLVTSQGTLDRWIYDLRATFALFRNKNDEIFLVKFFQKCRRLSWKIFPFLQWISGHPGEASYVYFLIFSKFLVRTSAALKIFGHSQIRSKTTKMTKSPQKSQNFANLSVLAKIIGLALRFDQFWAQSDQKSPLFGLLKNFGSSL